MRPDDVSWIDEVAKAADADLPPQIEPGYYVSPRAKKVDRA